VRAVDRLRELADDFRAGGVDEASELFEVLVDGVAVARALDGRADEDRALRGRSEIDDVACDETVLRNVGYPVESLRRRRAARKAPCLGTAPGVGAAQRAPLSVEKRPVRS
jgi:hypothetical protein